MADRREQGSQARKSAEAKGPHSWKDVWEKIDLRRERVRVQQDRRLLKLLQGVDRWHINQSMYFFSEQDTFYAAQNEEGRHIQLAVTGSGYGFRVTEYLLDSDQDPHHVGSRQDVKVPGRYVPVSGTFSGLTVFSSSTLFSSANRTELPFDTFSAYVGYSDVLVSDQNIPNGYGRYVRSDRTVEFFYERPKEIERRLDPFEKGERTLQLLQSATLLGRFDVHSGRLVEPARRVTA